MKPLPQRIASFRVQYLVALATLTLLLPPAIASWLVNYPVDVYCMKTPGCVHIEVTERRGLVNSGAEFRQVWKVDVDSHYLRANGLSEEGVHDALLAQANGRYSAWQKTIFLLDEPYLSMVDRQALGS